MTGSAGVEGVAPILIVDDDEAARTRLATVLQSAGLDTRQARNGHEALERVADEPLGAVVLDAQMAVTGGLATLRALRSQPATSTLPVVLVTGTSDSVQHVASLEAGADDYLVKPVDPDEFVARVRAHVRAHTAWSQVVDGHRRERAAVTQALQRATVAPTLETAADAICAGLQALPQIAGVAILAFTGEDSAVTLAARGPAGDGLRPGSRTPATLSRRLRELADQGPGLGPRVRHPQTAAPLSNGRLSPCDEMFPTAYAPIRGRRLQGVLVAAADERAVAENPGRAASHCLTAAIDFAAVADALLGPALDQRGEVAHQRSALLHALDARTFSPVFQPIVTLADERVVGYELLTRFDDGAAPERRFAEAAAVGMGVALERATMAIGVAAAVTLPEDAFLSVNVSPSFLLERGGIAVAELARACARRIVLEITEHDPIEDYGAVLSAIEDLGVEVQLSVDDAGAGYACLHHILALRPAFVKLDQSWIAGLDADPARQALVAGLRHFAGRTGCRLIAEGVETEAELAALRELDVTLGQGFLLGRPAPVRLTL